MQHIMSLPHPEVKEAVLKQLQVQHPTPICTEPVHLERHQQSCENRFKFVVVLMQGRFVELSMHKCEPINTLATHQQARFLVRPDTIYTIYTLYTLYTLWIQVWVQRCREVFERSPAARWRGYTVSDRWSGGAGGYFSKHDYRGILSGRCHRTALGPHSAPMQSCSN